MAAARQEENNRRRPGGDLEDEREAKRTKLRVVLNTADSNLDFNVNGNGLIGSSLHEKGFSYCWSGARANLGVLSGRYCFGCKVTAIQKVDMPDTPNDQKNLCRVGVSRGDSDVACLGESKHSFGFGGSGKFSVGGSFKDYGEKFGVGDTIVCAVDLESKPMAKISFSKNGKWLGIAKEFDAGPAGVGVTEPVFGQGLPWARALFPHLLLKNVTVQMQFSVSDGLVPMQGYKPWDVALEDGLAMEGPRIGNKSDCELLMMVGLPASGKTSWAEQWSRDHQDKRYVILGTNLALDQMKVPGLLRKHNYAQRFEQLMSRATEIFNTLLERASTTPRNYIIDQTNVYLSARKRKLKLFNGFRKIAVVVVPKTDEHARRTTARAKELGKEVPIEAVNDMKANFVLPKSKDMAKSDEPFDEVWFVETQRQEAEQIVQRDKNNLPKPVPRQLTQGGRGMPLPMGSLAGGLVDHWGNPLMYQRGNMPMPMPQNYVQGLLGSPDKLMGPRGEMLGPRGEILGPRGEMLGQRGDMMGQRGELVGPRGEMLGPRGELLGPRGELLGPRGELIGQRGEMLGQRGELLGQRGDMMGQRGDMLGPRGELLGPRGELLGQRGELINQRGELLNQRGEPYGQRVELIGHRGEMVGPRGELMVGQRGMNMPNATGLPMSAYDALNSLSPTMNLSRNGYESLNPATGLPRSAYDGMNGATGMPRSGYDNGNYDAVNTLNGLQKAAYEAGKHANGLGRSPYDIVGPAVGLPMSGHDGLTSANGLPRGMFNPNDGFNPNYTQNMSSVVVPEYGGAPHPHAQAPGLRGPLLPLPTQQPSRPHYY
ncbi:hypothetical protein MPTK1_6g00470 [Marchantia polymorpha subsp. ruderalis]|uniref:SPRY domain-containing protein n=2 Tax=Marchantia polymorpha TaxID=3197 RepID=A0AAF6BM28_MARPO|nr:hypothetical protein MARPO_0104s0019 [Marchantia polymorpha]BBN13062.1 hypothetical protein Mp_6g00470 [Marchantia polymorpha subsp. ruderalis]|eukprot:PTQ31983.1 hypothetical protein MARPO_0104s0019 [Marchantia polymorpha]